MKAISVRNVSKGFKQKGELIRALADVSLGVQAGEVFALIGPNGSGKTTLINIMLGLLRPDRGSVHLFGADPIKERGILCRINYTASDRQHHWMLTPKQIISTYAQLYNVPGPEKRASGLIEKYGLKRLANRHWIVLSTGEKARVRLAKTLVNSPELIILDEPTLGLDPATTRKVWTDLAEINRSGTTIFLTSHNMAEVSRLAHSVAFIVEGRIVHTGTVSAIKKKWGSLEKYWLRMGV